MYETAKKERIKKGHHTVKAGEMQNQLLVLISGIFRGYVIDENGQDITDCFAYQAGDIVAGCNGLTEPSLVEIESLTECELIRVPTSVLFELMEQYPLMHQIYNQILTEALKRHWELKRMLYQPAMQRYQWFLDRYPGLIDRVSNKYIASFLGMTPVTLSRLRRHLREHNDDI